MQASLSFGGKSQREQSVWLFGEVNRERRLVHVDKGSALSHKSHYQEWRWRTAVIIHLLAQPRLLSFIALFIRQMSILSKERKCSKLSCVCCGLIKPHLQTKGRQNSLIRFLHGSWWAVHDVFQGAKLKSAQVKQMESKPLGQCRNFGMAK